MSLKKDSATGEYVFSSGYGTVPLQLPKHTEQRVGLSFTGVSARVTLPTNNGLVEIAATEHCYLNFGDNTVDATGSIANDGDRLFLSGVQVVAVPTGATHVAALQVSTAGTLQVEAVE